MCCNANMKSMKRNNKGWGIFLMLLVWGLMASCGVKSSYYQKQQAIKDARWSSGQQPVFRIDIKDTGALYDLFFLIRHDEAYPNSNIWIRMKVKAPGDTLFRDGARIELELADIKGQWLGRGMGGIWEHKVRIPAREAPRFAKAGTYELKIEHLMRQDPLPSVLNVGLRIEQRKR